MIFRASIIAIDGGSIIQFSWTRSKLRATRELLLAAILLHLLDFPFSSFFFLSPKTAYIHFP